MSVRSLTVVGAAAAVVGVVLLVVATAEAAGALAATALAALAVGTAAVIAAGLLAMRTVHRQLHELRADQRKSARADQRKPARGDQRKAARAGQRSSGRGDATVQDDPVSGKAAGTSPKPDATAQTDTQTDAQSAPPPSLLALDDPVAAMLAGALPYHDASRELPDEQPLPALRVTRDPATPGCRVRLEQFAGDDQLAVHTLDVERVPLDRAGCPPRRRVHPAEQTVLELRTARHLDVDGPEHHPSTGPEHHPSTGAEHHPVNGPEHHWSAGAAQSGRVEAVWLAADGAAPADLDRVAEQARAHRYVAVPRPLDGDAVRHAALVLRLVAGGTPCRLPPEFADRLELLSPALRDALVVDVEVSATGHVGDPAEDDLALAELAARQKRLAWRDHDLRLGWVPSDTDQGDVEVAGAAVGGRGGAADTSPGERGGAAQPWVPQLRPMRRPTVSVALTSRRPELVPVALAMIAAQRDVELEVVVALHGCGDADEVERQLQGAGLDGRAMVVDAAVPFGAVVDAAADAGTGEYVLKWDDDDLYGPDHVLDLVLAQRQTGAGVVGKAPEFVHFDQDATTVWRTPGKAEAASLGLAGGTLLTPRPALDEIGGYPPVGRAVDHYLKVAMRDAGLGIFRTHGFGFALRRHELGHTWTDTEDRYRAQAVRAFAGIPAVVGLGDAARFAPLAAVTDQTV